MSVYLYTNVLLIPVRGATMQIWNNLRGDVHVLSTLLTDKRYPRRPSRTRRISKLVSPPNGGNRYGVKLTAYYKVCPFTVKCELCFTMCV
jgi:hypothetical protein